MELIPVESSAITHVGHDGHALHVVYRDGGHYVHPEVSEETFQQLLASEGKGEFLHKHLRSLPRGVK